MNKLGTKRAIGAACSEKQSKPGGCHNQQMAPWFTHTIQATRQAATQPYFQPWQGAGCILLPAPGPLAVTPMMDAMSPKADCHPTRLVAPCRCGSSAAGAPPPAAALRRRLARECQRRRGAAAAPTRPPAWRPADPCSSRMAPPVPAAAKEYSTACRTSQHVAAQGGERRSRCPWQPLAGRLRQEAAWRYVVFLLHLKRLWSSSTSGVPHLAGWRAPVAPGRTQILASLCCLIVCLPAG
jgi:hypothetical protein